MQHQQLFNVEVDGVDLQDYPKFCDAYISFAEDNWGVPLTELELDAVNEDSQLVWEYVFADLY